MVQAEFTPLPETGRGSTHSGLVSEHVQTELERVLATPHFQKAPQSQALLRFLVESTLKGTSCYLKESVIGVQVFHREAGYDPKADPVVRMAARRLREKLESVYELDTESASIRITVPKGTYVPQFLTSTPKLAIAPSAVDISTALPEVQLSSSHSLSDTTRVVLEPVTSGLLLTLRNSRFVYLGLAVAIGGLALLVASWKTDTAQPATYNRAVPFTSLPFDEYNASFSPNGQNVVYSWSGNNDANVDLYVQSLSGGQPRRLTTDPLRDESAAWSPDGRWIAFLRDIDRVFIVSPVTGEEREIGKANGIFIGWLPDSSAVIVPRSRPGEEECDLRTILLSNLTERPLAGQTESVSGNAPFAFSPDGRWFAYCHQLASNKELFVRAAAGGPPRQLTHMRQVIRGWGWNPNSRELVFSCNRTGTFALWRVPTDVPNAQPHIIDGLGDDALYPVMTKLGGSSARDDAAILLFEKWQRVLNLKERSIVRDKRGEVAGLNNGQYVFPSTKDDHSPQFAPDNHELAFISNRSGFDELWVGNVDSDQLPHQLTEMGQDGLSPRKPAWSPDGRYIVFAAISATQDWDDKEISAIYVVAAAGGKVKRLTRGNANDTSPSWSHDGKWIYFRSNRTGKDQIWKIPADAGTSTGQEPNDAVAARVIDEAAIEARESPDGKLFYIRKDPIAGQGIWQQPLDKPAAPSVAASLLISTETHSWWTVSNEGLFFVDANSNVMSAAAALPKSIFFFGRTTQKPRQIGFINSRFFSDRPDFCASPDGKRIIYSEFVIKNIDLMLVRAFH